MSPEELAARHPRLYHLTLAESVAGIMRHGLLATSSLLDLFAVPDVERAAIESARRADRMVIAHPLHGSAIITDNRPIVMSSLANCLDDGLQPADWLRLLNARVFFWVSETGLQSLAGAQLNRGRKLAVLVVDTLGVARAHRDRIELSAINSGSTVRRPPRRGLSTFTPLGARDYKDWQTQRGRKDTIREVTVRAGVPDIAEHMIEVRDSARP